MKKMVIDSKIFEVIPHEKHTLLSRGYSGKVAVEWNGMVYPERNKNDEEPGIYSEFWGTILKHPETEEDKEKYSAEKAINFDSDNIRELLDKSNTLKNIEKDLLTNPGNEFIPPLFETDSPEIRGLKTAVIKKKIDIDLYKDRFGDNYNNDKRFFAKDNITMLKFKSITDKLDMKCTLIIEDKDPDVPNPIGERIIIDLTGGEDINE